MQLKLACIRKAVTSAHISCRLYDCVSRAEKIHCRNFANVLIFHNLNVRLNSCQQRGQKQLLIVHRKTYENAAVDTRGLHVRSSYSVEWTIFVRL